MAAGNQTTRSHPDGVDPFVGRERPLHRVTAACQVLEQGHGCLVVVSGESGVGKTRFCTEVAKRLRASGTRVVTTRCWPDGGAPPLWPWHPILAALGDGDAPDPLTSGPRFAGPDDRGTVDERRGAGGQGGAEMGADRFARFVAVTEQLARACARTPVCLVIDDAHGADAETLLLVRFVARSLPSMPLALVLSHRSPEQADHVVRGGAAETPGHAERGDHAERASAARLLAEMEGEGTSIVLHRFDRTETAAFLANHGQDTLDDAALDTLFRVTGGHPLLLRRTTQATEGPGAGDAESQGDGRSTGRGTGPGAAAGPAPPSVRVAIGQALARLSPSARDVLSRAAVLGPEPGVTEAAAVAGCDPVAVLDAVAEATTAGLVTTAGEGRFSFGHGLVHAAVEGNLGAAERLEAHARAAAVMAGDDLVVPTAARLARASHHARRAAARSPDDTRRAVSICRAAARAMVRGPAYDRADRLLSAAVELHESPQLGDPPAGLLLEWADTAVHQGHMEVARNRYDAALIRAEAEGEATLVAAAALGLGGIWVDENRTAVEQARMQGLYRKALAGLPPGTPGNEVLRCRLGARLVAQVAFDGGPTEPLAAAVESVRATGDPHALAEALSLWHFALFTPHHARVRLAVAEELVKLASETGQQLMTLMGMLWRTIDLIHLADVRVTAALEALRERAAALGNQHILYYVGIIDVLRLNNRGRLDDAEARAQQAFELGERIGRADSVTLLYGQIGIIRWLQGRDAENFDALGPVVLSPNLPEREFGPVVSRAWMAARQGEHDAARAILRRVVPPELADIGPSRGWMSGLVNLVEVAAILGDEDLSRQAYDLLAPFAALPTIAGLAAGCLGSTERPLGIAAATWGDDDLAVAHLERAIAANQQMESRPMLAIARANLAHVLHRRNRRGGPGPQDTGGRHGTTAGQGAGGRAGDTTIPDRERAVAVLEQAVAEATRMGLTGRVATWEGDLRAWRAAGHGRGGGPGHRGGGPGQRAGVLPGRDGGPADGRDGGPAPTSRRGLIRRDGRRWVVAVDERRVRVANLVGMAYIAELLTHPGRPIPAVTLAGYGAGHDRPVRHELIDDDARSAYAARARELNGELAQAEADNDLHRAERLRVEMDALVDHLEAAVGLHDQARHFPDDGERARTSVRKAIKRAIDAIDDADPVLAETLRQTVSTGATCAYHPDPARPVAWSTSNLRT